MKMKQNKIKEDLLVYYNFLGNKLVGKTSKKYFNFFYISITEQLK